ncbi:50S ribosomal protein L3 N(5)-glutamine methyltransferase [Zwartia vadi]|uniref:50S ribosomal protein L3 N(5)-glutamine methyltransferase n=1 Tax=Zwartia vadi TaxID=3058168 RepID=UPI0025B42711|nr:50S ribosomal protein L3 N(5)-glutamine methyltransferase [Zwartia vadi]MDN3986370.1 50S ribosomal protein L3 N(5)-glutamine methyltransferase [Zwartia vadi]
MTTTMDGSREALCSVRDLVRYAVSRFNESKLFFGHGSDNAWDEAVYLVLHALHLPPDQLEPFMEARVLPSEREAALSLIDLRCEQRLPAPYLTHEAWLQGYSFHVDQRVIIPRSPIAELLMNQLSPWIADPYEVTGILDLCTGSGCLAIIAAHQFPEAFVDATDISKDALDVALINVEQHGLKDRLNLHHGSLYDPLPVSAHYDLIISNPPYVNSASMLKLPPEYRHEPSLALAGGDDGMDLVRTIIEQAPAHLSEDGLLLIEIGHERPYFEAAFPDLEPVWLDSAEASDQILLLTKEQLTP